MRILLFINNKFTIFANRLTTNEDMNRTGTIYNALNMRGLQELPPPGRPRTSVFKGIPA